MGISRNHTLRGYAVWMLRVRWDAEHPDCIPPAGALGRSGTRSIQ